MTIFDIGPFLYPLAVVTVALAVIGLIALARWSYKAYRYFKILSTDKSRFPSWNGMRGIH